MGPDAVPLTHQQRPVGRDRRQVGSPAARDRPHQPLHRQVHDPHRVSHGGPRQQPTPQRGEPDRGSGEGGRGAVGLRALGGGGRREAGHGGPRQQPTPQRVEPDRGSGEGERDAVDLRALEAVDRGEAGLGAPRDVDAVAGRREGQRPGMIAQRDEGRLAAAQRIHEQHSRVARHREQVAPARRGDVAATRWGDLLAVSSDSGVLLMDPLGRREPAFVALSDHPRALAFSPSGHRIYVTRRTEPGLAAIDRFERAEIDGIALPLPAAAIRLDPLGRWLLARPTVGDSVWVVDLPVKRLVGAVASGWRADLPAIAPDGSLLVRQGDDVVAYRPDSLVETGRLKGAAADLWTLSPWRPRGGYRGAFADAQAAAGQPGNQGGGAADTAGAPRGPPGGSGRPAPTQGGAAGVARP